MPEEKVTCRTPNADGTTRIPRWKFDAIRTAILHAIDEAGPEGLSFKQINDEVKARLSDYELDRLGSVGWHATSVKLEMEVAGDIARVVGVTPQRIVRAA
ncbi:MAG: hypothetical protein QNJ20_05625 [Paracoccaceae bacterium]|nr:hypothetical protein [Paracoccaceae bacterium]